MLAGELANSSPSSLARLEPAWARLQKMTRASPGPPLAGIESIWEGRFVGGRWVPGRLPNGDESHQGRHLRIPPDDFGIQRSSCTAIAERTVPMCAGVLAPAPLRGCRRRLKARRDSPFFSVPDDVSGACIETGLRQRR
jgi:hypothetical protein